ncbi:hypothetical protein SAMN05421541_106305 [Actinoplanes philippinensis]|uniref:Uncharacterized protein n=1 Tax=Actinoplanes philippinensis TaxID=35752 RepID=A0A1I2G8T0_9ACTN|nr:hypothetical protein SAMN05421541_106305 [Actinoplanes philippinensis]
MNPPDARQRPLLQDGAATVRSPCVAGKAHPAVTGRNLHTNRVHIEIDVPPTVEVSG